ncbi:glycosyltransferase family 2 protein [Bacteroides caecicola]|uniref:Glycosyltransferase family 2 protein n=1 Tax=Bacteroides caecicola TaxID=1462569 RepID=A0ABS2FB92_9BACE|nr:glycosyltransferase family 2 protein [Bacteroides caecicola]MBM6807298.1 glycosyltransferase family 2 protein [Bacteroides caecicola]
MISVLIPVYNTSKYLSQCVNSILNQSYRNLEIILVNDASTDNSLAICKKYKELDKRIILINKEKNEGVEKARLTALEVATGDFFCFVDSDDWLEKDALAVMHERAVETNVDYVEIGVQHVLDKYGLIKKKSCPSVIGSIQQPELFEKYYLSFFGVNLLGVNIWGKLYKAQSIKNNIPCPSGLRMGEDLYFNLCIFPYLKSIYIDSYVGYNYRFGGMTSRYNPTFLKDMKYLYSLKKEFIEQYQYFKANDFIKIELKNVLKSEIRQKILFQGKNSNVIIDEITQELSDPIYKDIGQVDSDKFLSDPFVKAIIYKDAQTVYEMVNESVKKERLKWRLKKYISLLLQKL